MEKRYTLRDFLLALGAEKKSHLTKDFYSISESPILDLPIRILRDDGIGYSPTTEYIVDVDNIIDKFINVWIESDEYFRNQKIK